MVAVLESKMYVAVDPLANNNKFWKYERYAQPITENGETGDLKIVWGRVGSGNPEFQIRMYDEKWLASKVHSKLRGKKNGPPYTECQVMEAGATPKTAKSITDEQVKKLAVKEISGGCPVTSALVKKLAEANRHELITVTGGKMDIDLETGLVSTALGVVTINQVKNARILLDGMAPYVTKSDTGNSKFTDLLGEYLRLVPQDVGRRKGWYESFINLQVQTQLLDQLEASVELAEQRIKDAVINGNGADVEKPVVFNVKLVVVSDDKVIDRVTRMYSSSSTRNHESSRLKPARVYEVEIPHMTTAFKTDGEKVGNVKLLWHGTRMFNVLSILKRGFVLPHQLSTVQTTGAMYGPGLYFSANSTKSLNYSRGGVWSTGIDKVCYMFLVDVAMGKEYIPRSGGNGKKPGFDSCWAKPGQSGVINDEQIVFRASQTNIRYMVEFSE